MGQMTRDLAARLLCLLLFAACADSAPAELGPEPDAAVHSDDAGASGGVSSPRPDRFNAPPGIPDAWLRVHSDCSISLRGPELVERASIPSEHCIASFADADCTYQVEYGPELEDAFKLAEGANYAREQVLVGGDAAELIRVLYRLDSDAYLVALRIETFRRDPPEYALMASARCSSEAALETARLVLQTVDLPHVGEGLCVPIGPQKCSIN
jgi:hypothetical protein